MTIRLFAPLSIAIALYGCASTAGVYQNPTDNLRTISLNQARGYASETRPFLEKNGQEKTITAVQDSIKATLKDPDSAQFQNIRIADYDGGKVVCGEINAKNSYGGYVGYKSFVAGISGSTIFSTRSEYQNINDASNAGINAACGF
jgi:hypothetical protein